MPKQSLTQEALKSCLRYDEKTGDFICLNDRAWLKAGDKAGSVTKGGYIEIRLFGARYFAHRLAWFYVYGVWPREIDHDNRIRSDNRFCNLFNVTSSENRKNMPLPSNNKSGYIGVSWCKKAGKWTARIRTDEKYKFLGYYDNKIDAAITRKMAEYEQGYNKNHGE